MLVFAKGAPHDAYVCEVVHGVPDCQGAVGMFLGAMYIGNLLCALASAAHHRAVTTEQIATLGGALTLLYAALPMYACVHMGVVPVLVHAVNMAIVR